MAKVKGASEGEAEWLAQARANRLAKRPAKIGAYLTDDARYRLRSAALVEGLDQSSVLEGLIRAHLSGYYAGQRGVKDAQVEAETPDPRLKLSG